MSIVSFDFDGVLHTDVDGIHPTDWSAKGDQSPGTEMIKLFKREAMKHEVVIVTARCEDSKKMISKFAETHGLPVASIFTTCGDIKMPLLRRMGAIRHYDDNIDILYEMAQHDKVEFIHVVNDEIVNRFMATSNGDLAKKSLKNYLKGIDWIGRWVSDVTFDRITGLIVWINKDIDDEEYDFIVRPFMGFDVETRVLKKK